jgi:hypothetical protein
MKLVNNEETKRKDDKEKGATFQAPYSVINSIDTKVKPVLEAAVLVGLTCLIL